MMEARIKHAISEIMPEKFKVEVDIGSTGHYDIRVGLKLTILCPIDPYTVTQAITEGAFNTLMDRIGMGIRTKIGVELTNLLREHYGKV